MELPEATRRYIDAALQRFLQSLTDELFAHQGQILKPAPTPAEYRVLATSAGARWTPATLAKACQVRPETIRRIEAGRFKYQRNETWTTIDKMASVLGVPRAEYRLAVTRKREAYLHEITTAAPLVAPIPPPMEQAG